MNVATGSPAGDGFWLAVGGGAIAPLISGEAFIVGGAGIEGTVADVLGAASGGLVSSSAPLIQMPLLVSGHRGMVTLLNSESEHPARFKFHEWGRFVPAAAGGSLLFLFIAVVTMSRRQFDLEMFLLVWSGSWFYLVVSTAFVINNCDLVVDNSGISRVLFDNVEHRINWTSIELVREYSLRDNGRNARCIQIVLTRDHFFAWQLYRKMVITDSMDHFDEFIELLNKRIAGQPVKVELRINGQWQPRSQLVTDF